MSKTKQGVNTAKGYHEKVPFAEHAGKAGVAEKVALTEERNPNVDFPVAFLSGESGEEQIYHYASALSFNPFTHTLKADNIEGNVTVNNVTESVHAETADYATEANHAVNADLASQANGDCYGNKLYGRRAVWEGSRTIAAGDYADLFADEEIVTVDGGNSIFIIIQTDEFRTYPIVLRLRGSLVSSSMSFHNGRISIYWDYTNLERVRIKNLSSNSPIVVEKIFIEG